jgi:hypothetical protein
LNVLEAEDDEDDENCSERRKGIIIYFNLAYGSLKGGLNEPSFYSCAMLSRQSAFACPEGSMPKCIRREGFFHVILYLFFLGGIEKCQGLQKAMARLNHALRLIWNFVW